MKNAPWESSVVTELDLTSTELSKECLENILLRIPSFTYLGLGYCEFFTDRVSFTSLQQQSISRRMKMILEYIYILKVISI